MISKDISVPRVARHGGSSAVSFSALQYRVKPYLNFVIYIFCRGHLLSSWLSVLDDGIAIGYLTSDRILPYHHQTVDTPTRRLPILPEGGPVYH